MLFIQSNVRKSIWIEYTGWDNGKVWMVSCFISGLNILGQLKLVRLGLGLVERRQDMLK
jgi:hypothetical protein